jgi:Tfp pilus assembly protein PilF
MTQADSAVPLSGPPAPPARRGSTVHAGAAATVLVLVVIVAFVPCLSNGFVAWDDDKNILNNPGYRGLGWSQIRWDWTSFQLGVYQPLAWMILGTEWLVWGLRPWGYHLASLGLHALNTVVLFLLTLALLARVRHSSPQPEPEALIPSAALAVGLYAVHPLRTEVVAWASCQPYLPCALFSMLAILAYLRAFPEGAAPHRRWLVVACGLFAAALASKAVAVALSVQLLILDVHPLRRLGGGPGRWLGPAVRPVWWEKLPFLGLSLVFMGLAVVGRIEARDLVALQDWGIPTRFAQACYAIGFYPLKTALPWNLAAYYPIPERVVWYEFPFVICILGTLGASTGLFLLRRRWPGLLAAWLSYLVILAPTLGLVRFGEQIAADRYSYLALTAGVVVLAGGLSRVWPARWPSRPLAGGWGVVTLSLLVSLILLSRDQCRTWRTATSLWSHAVRHGASRSAAAHSNLGSALLEQGRLVEAREALAIALRINPGFGDAHNNLGLVLNAQGCHAEARAEFAAASRLDPGSSEAHNNLGVLLKSEGRLEEARAEFVAALRIDPLSAVAHANLGVLLGQQGRFAEAAARFRRALAIDPDHVDAHTNLGVVLAQQGRLEEAVVELSEALRINPQNADARHNRGALLRRLGRIAEARERFRTPGH